MCNFSTHKEQDIHSKYLELVDLSQKLGVGKFSSFIKKHGELKIISIDDQHFNSTVSSATNIESSGHLNIKQLKYLNLEYHEMAGSLMEDDDVISTEQLDFSSHDIGAASCISDEIIDEEDSLEEEEVIEIKPEKSLFSFIETHGISSIAWIRIFREEGEYDVATESSSDVTYLIHLLQMINSDVLQVAGSYLENTFSVFSSLCGILGGLSQLKVSFELRKTGNELVDIVENIKEFEENIPEFISELQKLEASLNQTSSKSASDNERHSESCDNDPDILIELQKAKSNLSNLLDFIQSDRSQKILEMMNDMGNMLKKESNLTFISGNMHLASSITMMATNCISFCASHLPSTIVPATLAIASPICGTIGACIVLPVTICSAVIAVKELHVKRQLYRKTDGYLHNDYHQDNSAKRLFRNLTKNFHRKQYIQHSYIKAVISILLIFTSLLGITSLLVGTMGFGFLAILIFIGITGIIVFLVFIILFIKKRIDHHENSKIIDALKGQESVLSAIITEQETRRAINYLETKAMVHKFTNDLLCKSENPNELFADLIKKFHYSIPTEDDMKKEFQSQDLNDVESMSLFLNKLEQKLLRQAQHIGHAKRSIMMGTRMIFEDQSDHMLGYLNEILILDRLPTAKKNQICNQFKEILKSGYSSESHEVLQKFIYHNIGIKKHLALMDRLIKRDTNFALHIVVDLLKNPELSDEMVNFLKSLGVKEKTIQDCIAINDIQIDMAVAYLAKELYL